MTYSTKQCKRIVTKDLYSQQNGFLTEIASSKDGWSKFLDNAQIYLTTILSKSKKGFHLHHKKENQVICIKGKVILGVWDGKTIEEFILDSAFPIMVRVPKEHALCFYNPGDEEVYVLNLCSPPYDPNDPEQEDIDLAWTPKNF